MDFSLAGVFVAGLLTFLSPCVLPLVPVYLAILTGEISDGGSGRFRAVLSTLLFTIGFTSLFSLMGLTATAVGQVLARNKVLFQQIGGIVILLLGLRFIGWLRIPWLDGGARTLGLTRLRTRFHFLNVFVLGVLFAFAWSPCIGSVLGAVLTWASLKTTEPGLGALYLSAYGLGFAVPLLVVAALAGPALQALRRARRFVPVFEKVTGTLMVTLGLLLTTDRLTILDEAVVAARLQAATSGEAGAGDLGMDAPSCRPGDGATCEGVGEQPMPRMIRFYSPSCPICLQMIPTVNLLRQACQSRQVAFESVDVSTPEGKALARKYRVTGIPVFIFEDLGGREVARLVGSQSLETMEQAMSVLIGERCLAYREIPGLAAPGDSP